MLQLWDFYASTLKKECLLFSKQCLRSICQRAPCNNPFWAPGKIRAELSLLLKSNSHKHLQQKAWERAEGGSDRIKSSDPFLQAAASAEETLEDRDAKIWAHGSGMEDVWRCSQHSLLPASSPPTHSPTLIELFASPPVIVAGALNSLLLTVSLAKVCFDSHATEQPNAYAPKCGWSAAERLRKGGCRGLQHHNSNII